MALRNRKCKISIALLKNDNYSEKMPITLNNYTKAKIIDSLLTIQIYRKDLQDGVE